MPTATIVTDPFRSLFTLTSHSLGQDHLPVVFVSHPIVSVPPAGMRERARRAMQLIVQTLAEPEALAADALQLDQPADATPPADTLSAPDSLEEIYERFEAEEWTDGLPIIPPTRERVARMLAYCDLAAATSLGLVPPRWSEATVTRVAVNAVMAGCRAEYFPVVLTAVRGMLERQFNLYGVQGTTNPASPVVLLSGPIAQEVGVNSGGNLFGPTGRASATIGRAIRLILTCIGGGVAQRADKSTLGSPAKYTCCFAESASDNPWPPLHVDAGFAAETSTVTVFAGAAPTNIIDKSRTATELLDTIAGVMVPPGSNNLFMSQQILVVLGPDHAMLAAQAGLDRVRVRHELFKRARVDLDRITRANADVIAAWRAPYIDGEGGRRIVRVVRDPDDIIVVVAGGPGNHSAMIAGWHSRAVTRPIARADGEPVRSVTELRTTGAQLCV